MAADKLARVQQYIAIHPDFPAPGISFKDIFPVLMNKTAFNDLNDLLFEKIKDKCPDAACIVGLESRGFLFGPILALALEVPFVPIRKKGKLPGECVAMKYNLEYGTDQCGIQKSALKPGQKVVIVDDLLTTGGTMHAACSLLEKVGATVSLCLVVIELTDLKGRDRIKAPLESLICYTD